MRNCYSLVVAMALFVLPGAARAQPYRASVVKDIRWLGRGNAGVAVVSDGTAAFYNPGGLGKKSGYGVSLLNPAVGGNKNIYDAAKVFLESSPQSIADYLDPFMGLPLAGQASIFPYLRLPHFMAGYFVANDEVLFLHNPVNPELDVNYRYDRGVVLGGGVDFAEKLFVGASVRYQKRAMLQDTFGGSVITDLSLEALMRDVKEGEGWGLNVGAQYRHDLGKDQAIHGGVAISDVGNTTFRVQSLGLGIPARQATDISVGFGYTGRVPGVEYALLLDFNDLSNFAESYSKKVNFGAEVSVPVVTVRGGFHHGYWSAGASLWVLPFLSIDMASYAEELGVAGGQRSNRYYMIGLQMGVELGAQKKGRKQKYTLDHL